MEKLYIIKNGLLHKNGKPIFALGSSYYPSYHAKKVSVPHDEAPRLRKAAIYKGFRGILD